MSAELTSAEMDVVAVWDDGSYVCGTGTESCNGYEASYDDHHHENLYDAVASIVAARVAAALLEIPDAWLAYSSAEDGDAGDDFEHWIKARAAEIKSGGAA